MATQYDIPLIGQIDTGDEQRAKRMQDQYKQPVSGPRGTFQPAAAGVPSPPKAGSIIDGLAGGAGIVAGGAALPFAAGIDAARRGVASIAGGDPNTLPGGPNRYADAASATLAQGIDRASQAADQLKAGTRSVLGVQPRSIVDDMPVVAAQNAAPAQQAQPQSIIANMPGQPAASQTGATNSPTSMITVNGRTPPSIGDGIGTFSQMQPGDSQLALDRFERANQERQKMVDISRRGQIGEGGGRLTIVRDSSRAPSIADIQNARLDARQAQTNLQNQQAQQGILAGLDERLTSQLSRQRTQQELNIGDIQLSSQQRLEGLAAQLADPSLSNDQRETARSAYTSLSTPAKDRYQSQDIIIGRDENGRDIRGSQLIDVTTGRPVSAGGIGDGLFGLPAGVSKDQALSEAKAAIASGVSKDAVNRRLRDWGLDPV